MKIITKLKLTSLAALVILCSVLLTVYWHYNQSRKVTLQYHVVDQILQSAFDLNVLTNSFVYDHSERSKHQWYARHDTLLEFTSTLKELSTGNTFTLTKINRNHTEMKIIFEILVKHFENSSEHKSDIQRNSEVVERFANQLLVKAQMVATNAQQIKHKSQQNRNRIQRKFNLLILCFAVLFASSICFLALLIVRNVTNPIQKLSENAKKIGRGDFHLSSASDSQDEIGELSHSIEVMAKEIEKYRQAQRAMKKTLEDKVKERTEKINESYIQLEKEIQERKQVEDAVIASEDYLKKILNNIGDPVFVKDDQHRMTLVNDAFCSILGLSRGMIIGKTLAEDLPPNEMEHFLRIDRQVLTDGQVNLCEEPLTTKLGETLTIVTKKTRYVDENGNKFLIGVIRDITERKKTEEELNKYRNHLEQIVQERSIELKNAQKMLLQKERLAAIGQLSGSVAHDIRNPLGAISNSIYFLNLTQKDSADEQLKKHIGIIEKEIQRANQIITDLMDFSRENLPVQVEGQINTIIIDLLEDFALPEGITIETELDPHLPLFHFDSSQMNRVFLNLISNAIHAMSEGGSLHISSKRADAYIETKIKDSGTGIIPEVVENIFEPLYTTKSKGVGLGLSIVNTFVEKHNGTVKVESEVGKGTTFTVKLPIKQPEIS